MTYTTMSFIQNSWPKPDYLKKVPSYSKSSKIKKTKVFFSDTPVVLDNYTLINGTNSIIQRSPVKYAADQLFVCAMVWWLILGGVKNSIVRFFNQSGTRY